MQPYRVFLRHASNSPNSKTFQVTERVGMSQRSLIHLAIRNTARQSAIRNCLVTPINDFTNEATQFYAKILLVSRLVRVGFPRIIHHVIVANGELVRTVAYEAFTFSFLIIRKGNSICTVKKVTFTYYSLTTLNPQ